MKNAGVINLKTMHEECEECERNIVIRRCWNCIYKALKDKLDVENRREREYIEKLKKSDACL